jgi:drug/metabolite transporter (DMT)-like permease
MFRNSFHVLSASYRPYHKDAGASDEATPHPMSAIAAALLAIAVAAFVGAGTTAKFWANSNGNWPFLVLTLSLYTIGNLAMLPLIKNVGLGIALSLSAVAQLLAINFIAIALFGERVGILQAIGIALAVLSVGLLTYPR